MRRGIVVVTVIGGAAVLSSLAACSDGGADLKSDDPPEEIVAYGIDELGPDESVLPVEQSRQLAVTAMAATGSPRAEADCVMALALPLVGGEEGFAKLTISEVARLRRTAKKQATTQEERNALDRCVSDESEARAKSGELAPDIDIELARELGAAGAELNGQVVGLTAAQAKCYADAAYRDIDLETVRGSLEGKVGRDARQPGQAILDCVPRDRVNELAEEIEAELLRLRAEHDAEEQRIQQEINSQLASTTTVAP